MSDPTIAMGIALWLVVLAAVAAVFTFDPHAVLEVTQWVAVTVLP